MAEAACARVHWIIAAMRPHHGQRCADDNRNTSQVVGLTLPCGDWKAIIAISLAAEMPRIAMYGLISPLKTGPTADVQHRAIRFPRVSWTELWLAIRATLMGQMLTVSCLRSTALILSVLSSTYLEGPSFSHSQSYDIRDLKTAWRLNVS